MKKIVSLISTDRRYRKEPYPSVPIRDDEIGTFLTGQHIDPHKSDTRDNLTVDEMTGKVTLSDKKAKTFPHIINPEFVIPLIHMTKIDVSLNSNHNPVNAKDYAFFNYLHYQPVVALSKDKVIPGKHFFYIEDKELEAEIEVTRKELSWEAMRLIKENTSMSKLSDIITLLNYNIKNFNVNVDVLNKSVIEKKLWEACEKHPQDVIACYQSGAEETLYILKLVKYNIITLKQGNFYDGITYIGNGIDKVKQFMRDDREGYVNKWGKLLMEIEEPAHTKKKTDKAKEE